MTNEQTYVVECRDDGTRTEEVTMKRAIALVEKFNREHSACGGHTIIGGESEPEPYNPVGTSVAAAGPRDPLIRGTGECCGFPPRQSLGDIPHLTIHGDGNPDDYVVMRRDEIIYTADGSGLVVLTGDPIPASITVVNTTNTTGESE